MTKKMLIDATHPEETRVAIVSGNRLEEYDYENALRKQLKSNIYLVKVTRVEPSLQAAFVDFGGNRHGFLPFPEIHPDYYRIPIADREALLAEERAIAAREAERMDAEDEAELAQLAAEGEDDDELVTGEDDLEAEDEDDAEDLTPAPRRSADASLARRVADKLAAETEDDAEDEGEGDETLAADSDDEAEAAEIQEDVAEALDEGDAAEQLQADAETHDHDHDHAQAHAEDENFEEVGGDSVEPPAYRSSLKRRYKIQEVIKRNQIMLIQISKEERGNKGAAVTSYISLPGRYCVLMPNSPRGGGVSRKVSNAKDRQRLKTILRELNVPEGMSVILRTAGVSRTTAEIKRDLDYLLRLWDEIREFTLKSTAPQLIYEEGNLIKRAIRDLYKRDIDEIHVAGEEGFKTARDFMQMLAPANVDKVHHYNDSLPLFYRYQVDSQIDAIQTPTVHLKSGGYIVINPTEALVSIDVNSGRATKGRHIEETALKTNIEAAEEIARQLRLRDQGGLIVIDFIDMEDRRANRIVEKKMRDAMQSDRARIQIGRISPFGLMELSRQRLHPSLVETNFETCKHCAGTGLVRTDDTMAVMVLRALEEEAMKGRGALEIKVTVPNEIALYIFNHKRENLLAIEKRYNCRVFIGSDDRMIKPAFTIEGGGQRRDERSQRPNRAPVQSLTMGDLPDFEGSADAGVETLDSGDGEERQGGRRDRGERGERGRRRRGGRGRDRDRNRGERGERGPRGDQQAYGDNEEQPRIDAFPADDNAPEGDAGHDGEDRGQQNAGDDNGDRGRRRGRRGGRRRGGRNRGGRNRDGAEGGSEGSEGGQAQAGGDFDAPAANDRHERRERPERAERAERQQRAPGEGSQPQQQDSRDNAPTVHNRGDEGQQEAAGGTRKGWWKRLTE